MRQLFDLQQGVRKGPWSALMKSAVEKLTIDDMIAIAAYTVCRENRSRSLLSDADAAGLHHERQLARIAGAIG